MKNTALLVLGIISALTTAAPTFADTSAEDAREFPRVVSFELGSSEFPSGDSITIQELRGTSDVIKRGETYCVSGTYTLSSTEGADLSFFVTTTNRISTPIDPKQTVRITKGTGSFRLIKTMSEDGYPHVTFYSHKSGNGFGGVYFGQGNWVLREKHFSYINEAGHSENSSRNTANSNQPLSLTGPNQRLFDYLGNPVEPPPDLNPAYTKEGLTHAMESAAQLAGISLKKIEIDDSEFPFLVGIIFENRQDKEKLNEQIRKVLAYETQGGVGDEISYSMNIIPYRAFPRDAGQRIYHRLLLREAVLHDKITAQ